VPASAIDQAAQGRDSSGTRCVSLSTTRRSS
jgi:hypothetical protein